MKKTVFLLILFMMMATGCTSIRYRLSDDFVDVPQGPYPGLRITREIIGKSLQDKETFAMTWGLWFCWLPDVPLSLILDTGCLPYDLATAGGTTKMIWYGGYDYRVVKTDKHGSRHGKCSYQLHVDDPELGYSTLWGYERYKHGMLHGRAKTWGSPLWKKGITGEYRNGVPWQGSLLMHACDTNSLVAGPINCYSNGVLIRTSNFDIKLKEQPNQSTHSIAGSARSE